MRDIGTCYLTEEEPGVFIISTNQHGGIAISSKNVGKTANYNVSEASFYLEIADKINVELNSAGLLGVNYNFNIVVGIMLPNNELSFIPVYTCPIEATSVDNNPVQVDFTQELTGNYPGYRIAFRYGTVYSNYYAAIDDISVIAKLKCYSTPEVSITNISSTQVLFDVDYYADSLEVAYGVTGTELQNCTSFYTTMSSILIDELL